ncbi:hypothetical protein [Bizionia sp. M204]|uniref:hypothetical protein n=1 Tax=Bizionia sp. M204 TaxID=2675331 RepID=UPI00204F37AF|nr:hypothetical protein [Bizionia sp. M204]UPS92724.1 hypothetical protein GMA17_13775 [Bizionia sp. M204]
MLIIKFKSKRLYFNLALGLFWIVSATVSIWESDKIYWLSYVTMLIGVIYIGMSLWEFNKQYLTLTPNIIKENSLFGKKILLKDIIEVKKLFGDYILKTDQKELSINMSLVHDDSKAELNAFINSINVPEEETGKS